MTAQKIADIGENPYLPKAYIELLKEQFDSAEKNRRYFMGDFCPNCDSKNTWAKHSHADRKCEDCKCEWVPLI